MVESSPQARVRVTFPEAPAGVEVTDVLRLLSALTYEYDVAALMQGAKSTDAGRDYDLDDLPDFRPRWSPRLREDEVRLRIAGVSYGSPLVLEILGDPSVLSDWIKVIVAAGGAVYGTERLVTMPSRVRARIESNRAEALEARARSAAAQNRIRRELSGFGDPQIEVE